MEPGFLKNTTKELPFSVPEGYFEKLHREITGKTNQEALKSFPSGTVFHVPEAYFDSLPVRILERLPDRAGVIRRATVPATWYKTAVAACLALLLSILGVIQVEKMNEPDNSIANITNFDEDILVQEYLESLAAAPEEQPGEIETYLLNQVDEGLLIQELR